MDETEFETISLQYPLLKSGRIVTSLGRSSAGKTTICIKIIQNYQKLFGSPLAKCILVVKAPNQPIITALIDHLKSQGVKIILFTKGLCEEVFSALASLKRSPDGKTVVFFDDLLGDFLLRKSNYEQQLITFFTVRVHHNDLSLFVTLQNASVSSKLLQLLLMNSSYFVLSFYNSNVFSSTAIYIQKSLFPGSSRNLISRVVAYLKKNHKSYALFDCAMGNIFTDILEKYVTLLRVE